jgi:YVTN family beta-propeller protein
MKKITALFLLIISVVLIQGCSDSVINPVNEKPLTESGIYVVNEGLWGQNNSTVTYYDPVKKTHVVNLYGQANGGARLGDTGNDIAVSGNTMLISVTTSNKIEVVNTTTFASEGIIDMGSGSSPRRILIKDSVYCYVTGFNDRVSKVNYRTKQIEKSIQTGSYPEGIIRKGDKIYVANSGLGGGTTVSVIDVMTETVVKTINVGLNPINLGLADNGNLYVVCTGTYDTVGPQGSVYKIDPATDMVTDSLVTGDNPGEFVIIGNNMFVLTDAGVAKINLSSMTVENPALITGMTVNPIYGIIYSIGYDALTKNLLLGNPKDFSQNGEVVIMTTGGTEVERFGTGINPGQILVINK